MSFLFRPTRLYRTPKEICCIELYEFDCVYNLLTGTLRHETRTSGDHIRDSESQANQELFY